MDKELNHLVYTPKVIEFVTVASEYCGFLEKADRFSRSDFFEKTQKLLSLLYLKTSLIPSFEKNYEENTERFVTEMDYSNIHSLVAEKLGTYETFVDIYEFNAGETDEPVQVSLAECFADIYQDLKDLITNFQISNEEIMNDALWECKLNFEEFWGQRVLAVIQAIHRILFSGNDLDEDDNYSFDNEKTDLNNIDTSNWIITQKFSDYKNLNKK